MRRALLAAIAVSLVGCGGGPSTASVQRAKQECAAQAEASGFAAGAQQADGSLPSGPQYTRQDFATCTRFASDHGRADPYTESLLNGTSSTDQWP